MKEYHKDSIDSIFSDLAPPLHGLIKDDIVLLGYEFTNIDSDTSKII